MQHDLSNWTVVIVDDEPDNLGVMELVLRYHHAQVHIAGSGKECLELLETVTPTLLLVDIQMPGISGYDLLKLVRDQARWSQLPMIAVTAYAMEGDKDRVIAAGFNGYISKPIDAMKLAETLKSMLTVKVTP
jgi:CheY-like chemotaxis protein